MLLTWKVLAFPVVLGANVLLAAQGLGHSTASRVIVPALAGISLFSVWIAETTSPFVASASNKAERTTDWVFFGITSLIDMAMVALFEQARTPGGAAATSPAGVLLALLVWELGSYWAHRLAHELPVLWKFHALHHAPMRLTALNNFRLHPFDLVCKDAVALGAVGLCGFDAKTLILVAVIKNCIVAFQHANADLRHGWLSLFISTNTAHRWHHSMRPEEGHSNYGTVLLVWDAVFGTLRVSREESGPEKLGLFGGQDYPTNELCRSLFSPFCWRRCTAGSAEREVPS